MTTNHIKYRINSVTSQSPNYPASNLTDQSTTLGWQSQYSPSYPQQLNIQFFTPIRTKTMRLVFHQYKIPSCIQIFVRLTAKQNFRKLGYIIPNDNAQSSYQHKEIKTLYFEFPCNYIKLVFYQNYKNEMNLFEQVALEELSVEGEAMTYNELRHLDFTQLSSQEDSDVETGDTQGVHRGNANNENKVASKKPINPSVLPQMIQTQSMEDLNKQFQQVYAYLQEQKAQAVQNQDFKLAASLKNVIQTFKQTQQQIINLEIQKQQALAQEDFDKCHHIKQLIKKKKEEFQFRVEEMKQNQDMFVAQHSHSRIIHDQHETTDRKGYEPKTDIKNYFSSTPEREPLSNANQSKNVISKNVQKQGNNNYNSNKGQYTNKQQPQAKNYVDHNEQILPAVRKKMLGIKPSQEDEYPPETNRSQYESNKSAMGNKSRLPANKNSSKSPQDKHRSKSPPKSPKHKPTVSSNQNLSIKSPILTYEQLPQQTAQKRPQQLSPQKSLQQLKPTLTQLKQQFKHLQLQELDVKLRLKLQSHFDKIDQIYWQMIMNKSWNAKKIGLTYVLQNVNIEDKQTYMAVMEYISFSINDPHPQVIMLSLNILRKLIQQGNSNNVQFTLPHLPYFIQTIVTALLNLINSTNKQLSEQAYNLYLNLGLISFLTIQFLVQKIIKHKQTSKVTPHYTAMKISLMISLIQKYTETTKHYKDILLWAVEFLKDPNNKVRNQASYVLLILVDVVGQDKTVNVLKDKPELLELWNQMLNNSQLIQNSRIDNVSNLIEGSRINQRSKLEEGNNSSVLGNNKSLSKEKIGQKNTSQRYSQNVSSLSQQQSHRQSKQQKSNEGQNSNRLKNPWASSNDNTNKQKQSMKRDSSKSRLSSQRLQDQQLQYSKQSDFYAQNSRRQSQMYINRGYTNSELSLKQHDKELHVLDYEQQERRNNYREQQESYQQHSLEYDDNQYQQNEDNTKCDYCFMDMQGMDQREHLLRQCKVLVSCQQCMGRIYLREIIDHLLRDCVNKTHHQQCRKCGIVFGIDQINQHVGQGMCRLQRGDNWERCQFCGQDVMASDMKWVEHAYKCPNLPEPPMTDPTEKTSERAEEDDY